VKPGLVSARPGSYTAGHAPMRLHKLELENFRGFESLVLDFHPEVTVLVGANGSGKTTVLEAVVVLLANALGNDGGRSRTFAPTDARPSGEEVSLALTLDYKIHLKGTIRASYFPKRGALAQDFEWLLDLSRAPNFHPQDAMESESIAVYYAVSRYARDSTPGARDAVFRFPRDTWNNAWNADAGFHEFFHWFREREDVENAERVENSAFRDKQLTAVRRAIEALLPGYTHPHVRRPRGTEPLEFVRPSLVISKAGFELSFDQLSGGERVLVALAGDIARRLAIANPKHADPLQGEGVVLIDEVDLHLHPEWQAKVIPALRRTFPNVQLVVTTHSLVVLSYVPSECVRLLEGFQLVELPAPTEGREPNALATEVYGIPLRPPATQAEIARISALIDAERFDEARTGLEALSESIGENDTSIVRLQTALDLEDI
jgi:predicted ATP-binding protein involved in virulence